MQSCLDIIPEHTKRVLVAFSGGLDSSVLLDLLVDRGPEFEIVPWHINHGLHDAASAMEAFCVERAAHYNLDLRIDRLELGGIESNIEAEARKQRYSLFERHGRAHDCILTAHHADDQAETFLLNALRGSGSAGLRGIAQRRKIGEAWLLRPLLKFSRVELETYAAERELPWYNDPSNRESRFDRNYLRNEVSPILRKRWPNFQDSLATASSLQVETQTLLDEFAAEDLDRLKRDESGGFATLDLAALLELGVARRHNLIRYWIAHAALPALTQARMHELDRQLHARVDATPEIAMPDYSIRIYDQRLFLVTVQSLRECSGEYDFGLETEIEIEACELRSSRQAIFEQLDIPDRAQPLTLKFPGQGQSGQDRHRLKRLFQKHRVPPWQRSSVAQVYLDGELAGILP